ncbi:MAG: undecaprenyl-diphosphate phosphatase [Gammaproteobacteria bacterium]|nr:undecaprenyl-diphosphate phosphatase [Gammaproteobacteria bacterium]
MDLWLLVQALIQGIVEGLTEFLPISSTGHLIVSGALIGFTGAKAEVFDIVIQSGAILAVCWEYRRKIATVVTGLAKERTAQQFTANLLLAFLPAALLGLAFASRIKEYLFNPLSVAAAFIVGGLVILWAENRKHEVRVSDVDDMDWKDALKIGFAQCVALIPGTSRSGATIIGALLFGFSRKAATEFSFFLAIPTILAATVYDAYKHRALLDLADLPMFAVGFVAAFLSAIVAVRGLLRFVANHSFKVFAWYRIAFGLLILATAYLGWIDWSQA